MVKCKSENVCKAPFLGYAVDPHLLPIAAAAQVVCFDALLVNKFQMSTIIEPVVSFVIERIANLLSKEIKFLVGVEDQVNGLLKELTWMQSYLKDAEAKQEEFNEVDRVTFREITKIAYDAEDVVESFILEPPTTMRRKEGFFKKYTCTCCSALHTHQVGIEVEAIKKRIKETQEMFQRYNVRKTTLWYPGQSSTSMVPQVRSSPYIGIDEHVVGLHEVIELLVEELTAEEDLTSASIEELEAVWQCPSIKMDSLCKLSLQCRDNIEVPSLDPISHCHRLSKLTLRGRLLKLSRLPCNLLKLKLYQS
ncbi:hypothetical protein Ancab_001183 [Ancistrocladus abbreviatus]